MTSPDRHAEGPRRIILALLFVVLIVGEGCSRRRPNDQAGSADTLSNGIRRDAVSSLAPWLSLWRTVIPRLETDSLRFVGRAPALRGGYLLPWSEFESRPSEDPTALEVLMARSPDGRYRLVFDRYQAISEENGVVEIGGEPDSSPLLIDDQRRLALAFEFCGTPCGYDWGCWVDSMTFVLAGWSEIDDGGDSLRGDLGLYSLMDSTVARYVTPPVSSEDFQTRYREAWRASVTQSYRTRRSRAAARVRG